LTWVGIIPDARLSFNFHLQYIKPKIQKNINVFKCLSSNGMLPTEILYRLYHAYIHPYYQYRLDVYPILSRTKKTTIGSIPRSIGRSRKRPLLIVFDSFSSDRITAVFHRIVNERKRSGTPFSGRLRQLLTVYDTTKNGRNHCPGLK
jgi:hypothetical protein